MLALLLFRAGRLVGRIWKAQTEGEGAREMNGRGDGDSDEDLRESSRPNGSRRSERMEIRNIIKRKKC